MIKSIPIPSPLIKHFRLDPEVIYLNHGSFGACPTQVVEAQQRYRDRVEADAMRFYLYDFWGMVDRSREALGELINAQPQDLVFVNNATTAVATVLHNLTLEPGDELIVTDLEYPACRNNFDMTAQRTGAKVVVAEIQWEGICEDSIVEAILTKVTTRTKLVLISLIASATAVRMPVERIIRELKALGVETLLDAAHGPGCIPMDIDGWGAAYTTGNGHKWLCSPKGVAFLHVRHDLQTGFRPMVLSNHAQSLEAACGRTKRSALNHEFDYMGTDDRSGVLSIVDSIAFLNQILPGGIDEVMAHNRKLCLQARDLLCGLFGTKPPVPDSMTGPLAVIDAPPTSMEPGVLRERLFAEYRLETMIVRSPKGNGLLVRVSPQVYNSIEQYTYLGHAIMEIIKPQQHP